MSREANIRELELFLFGGRPICFDGTYRSERKTIYPSSNQKKEIIRYFEIDFQTGEFRTYDSKGNLDTP